MTARRSAWRRPARVTAVCAASLALIGTTAVSTAVSAAAAAAPAPIIIGGVGSTADFTGTDVGFAARINRQNKAGGINGHQIKFVGTLDDGASATTNLTDVQQLVQKDHVVAVAPVNALGLLGPSAAFLADHKTPFIGWGFLPVFCNNKWAWGFDGCVEPEGVYNTSTVAPMAKALGGNVHKLRVVDLENDNVPGIAGSNTLKHAWLAIGADFILSSDTMPVSGVTDYTPYVTTLLAAKPDVISLGATFAENVGLKAALVSAGYTGATIDYQTYVPGLLAAQPTVAKALQGEYIDIQIPPQESQSPATKQETKDVVATGHPSALTEGESLGYWEGDMLIQMLQATAKAGRPLTGAGLEKTVNGGFTYKGTLAGGIGPATFPKAEAETVPCAALVQVKGTAYHVAVPFACYKDVPAK